MNTLTATDLARRTNQVLDALARVRRKPWAGSGTADFQGTQHRVPRSSAFLIT
jgi:hypothetical protein